jgi:copper chaperone CopZ
MEAKKMTRGVLLAASAVVLTFAGLNVYTYAKGTARLSLTQAGVQAVIPVRGMACFTCEVAVQTAVKKLPGVTEIKASAKQGIARISYDPEKTSLEEIVQAIRETGYQADLPKL